jgi:hypothetical protein
VEAHPRDDSGLDPSFDQRIDDSNVRPTAAPPLPDTRTCHDAPFWAVAIPCYKFRSSRQASLKCRSTSRWRCSLTKVWTSFNGLP